MEVYAGNETVLTVDDEPMIRLLVTSTLEKLGYHLLEASNASGARQMAKEEEIQLLITDLNMPGENGLELASWFRKNHPAAKVMMASGDDRRMARKICQLERIKLLPKPFSPIELARAVRGILDGFPPAP